MSRIRYLKPEFFLDEDVADLSFAARLLFQGLWVIADREGRLVDRPTLIRVQIFPYDNAIAIGELLDELAKPRKHSAGAFIARYSIGDQRFIQIINFAKHQKPHPREAVSAIPAMPSPVKVVPRREKVLPSREKDLPSRVGNGEGKGNGNGEGETDPGADAPAQQPTDQPLIEGSDDGTPHVLAEPLPWNREAAELWRAEYRGEPPGALFKALKPLVKRETWERVRPALVTYLAETPAEYVNIAGKFVAAFGTWEARARGHTQARASPKAAARQDAANAGILGGLKRDGQGMDRGVQGAGRIAAGSGTDAGDGDAEGGGVPRGS